MCVYVRDLTMVESKRLSRGLKEVRTATYLRRMQVIAFSGQGMRAKEIAEGFSRPQTTFNRIRIMLVKLTWIGDRTAETPGVSDLDSP